MATFQVNKPWTWIYFFPFLLPQTSAKGRFCCSSVLTYFHGFMILYVLALWLLLRPLFFLRSTNKIFYCRLTRSLPLLLFYAERKENGKNLIFVVVIIRYNQITSDTRVRENVLAVEKYDGNLMILASTLNPKTTRQSTNKTIATTKDTDELSSTTKTISCCVFCSVISSGLSCFAFYTLFFGGN